MNIKYFDKDYFESGPQSGKSLYQNYRWIPELTLPLAHHIITKLNIDRHHTITDFGCAKGFLVKALRQLRYEARGVDVSDYAVSCADEETRKYLSLIQPGQDFEFSDFCICKDILEHVPYADFEEQLEILRRCCETIFVVVPLGDNGVYRIPAYEMDRSHYIREDESWWVAKLENSGFKTLEATCDLGFIKENWSEAHPKGNLLYIGS